MGIEDIKSRWYLSVVFFILLSIPVYSLSFVDTSDSDFNLGTHNNTFSINGQVETTNKSHGIFTSQVFDAGSNANFSNINVTSILYNVSDVIGYSHSANNGIQYVYYINGSLDKALNVPNLVGDIVFSISGNVTLPKGWNYSDIIGFGFDDDGTDVVYALFHNGSTAGNPSPRATNHTTLNLTQTNSWTMPSVFKSEDIIGFDISADSFLSAIFLNNGTYLSDNTENPPYDFDTYHTYTIPSGYNISDAIGIGYDRVFNDAALFLNNGSYLSDSDTNFNQQIDFIDEVNLVTYNLNINLSVHSNISIQYRDSNDNITWNDWSTRIPYIPDNNKISITSVSVGRYFQYRLLYKTGDPYTSPITKEVSIGYDIIGAATPTISIIYPDDYSTVNGDTFPYYINGTATNAHSITVNNSVWGSNLGTNNTWYFLNQTTVPEGNYTINITANGTGGTIVYLLNFSVDVSTPVLVKNTPSSAILYNTEGTQINVTATDNIELFRYNMTCYNTTGNIVISHYVENLNVSYYSPYMFLNWTGYPEQVFSCTTQVWDSHTLKDIGQVNIISDNINKIYDFVFSRDGKSSIRIDPSNRALFSGITTTLERDKITYCLNFNTTGRKIYYITTKGKLYTKKTRYRGHLVSTSGIWIDLEGVTGDYSIELINDTTAKITENNKDTELCYNSQGILNYADLNFTVESSYQTFLNISECYYAPEPYLKNSIPFTDNTGKIYWLCKVNTPVSCNTFVYIDGKLQQSNPQIEYIEGVGTVDYFKSIGNKGGYVRSYFTKKNLLPEEYYTFQIQCSDNDQVQSINKTIIPRYEDLYVVNYILLWGKTNSGFVIVVILLLILLSFLIKWYREQ